MNNVVTYLKNHKPLLYSIFGMLFLGIGLFAYSKFYSNASNVVNFTTYGSNDTSEVDKRIKKLSTLGNKLPNAEEIIKYLSSTSGAKSPDTYSDSITSEYGSDVFTLYDSGLIPSETLSDSDNVSIILSGNKLLGKDLNYFSTETIKNTKDYIDSLGEASISTDRNLVYTNNYEPTTSIFNNTSEFLELDSLKIGGAFVYTPINDEDNLSFNSLLYYKFNGDIPEDNNVIFSSIQNKKLVTFSMLVEEDMKISEIKDILSGLTVSGVKLTPFNLDNISSDDLRSIGGAYSLTDYVYQVEGKDYKVAKGSILQATFIIEDSLDLSKTNVFLQENDDNYLALNVGSPDATYDNSKLYTDFEY